MDKLETKSSWDRKGLLKIVSNISLAVLIVVFGEQVYTFLQFPQYIITPIIFLAYLNLVLAFIWVFLVIVDTGLEKLLSYVQTF